MDVGSANNAGAIICLLTTHPHGYCAQIEYRVATHCSIERISTTRELICIT